MKEIDNKNALHTGMGPLRIPTALLKSSGLAEADSIQLLALEQGVLAIPAQMKAQQVLAVVNSLTALAGALVSGLAAACGACEECGPECPYLTMDSEEQEIYHDLCDLPPRMMELLTECGICLGGLGELMLGEDIVYDAG